MLLNAEEEAMRAGEFGDGPRMALNAQIAVGEFHGARRFVAVTNAHVMGDWDVMGEGGHRYVAELVAAGSRVRIPTTRNPGPVDPRHAERLRQSTELLEGERRVTSLLRTLGVAGVDTCIGYQSLYQPSLGEHVAWGDTGAAIYANAVFGARTNFESGPAALAAALTGRTPAYGYHLEEHRRPNVRCAVRATLRDLADWGALGAVVGRRLSDYWAVPVFEGLERPPSPDALKHLGAALASYGSVAMFHLPGVTPEATAVDLDRELTVTQADLDAVYAAGGDDGGPVDLVVFSAPQLSLFELRRLADLLDGRRIADRTTVIVTTNAMTRTAAEADGCLAAIESTGALVLQGTCWYVMDPAAMRDAFGWRRLVTNSAKLVNIIKAHGYDPVLRPTDRCVQAALEGRLPAR